jgi:hypothetical protein
MQITAQQTSARWQNLEFRVGDNVTFSKSQGAH